ncbi:MAG: plasmid pRiA4b ORF-3 family protein [Gemmatimonadaceae bacterium]
MRNRVIPWKAKPRPARGLLHLTASLRGLRPRIWRSFVVPEKVSLAKLHRVLQVLFDWENQHLHYFQFGALRFAPKLPRDEEFEGLPPLGDDYRGITLAQFTLDLGDRFAYTYDMGDEWVVDLEVDGAQEGLTPVWCWCTSGARAGPPENCGGPPVFEAMAPLLPLGFDAEDRWMREMFPPDYNPSHFDLETLNKALARLR